MLEKRKIKKVSQHKYQHAQNQFLSNLFLVRKKDRGCRLVLNLKTLNQFLPYILFKMESLWTLIYMMKERDYMCKFNLKDTYFSVPIYKSCGNLVRFSWEANLYEFMRLCFGLGPVPQIFTKILKVPISLLPCLNIRNLIYLDNMLLMSQSIERRPLERDPIIVLLPHLGFVINF